MSDMQFEVLTDLATINPNHIETNFAAAKEYLSQAVAPYANMAVTDETVGSAKKSLASIRKLRSSINDQKIAVKRKWMEPYTDFENQVKELMGICDEGIDNLNGQIKAGEAEIKAKKLNDLKTYFEEHLGTAAEYLTWEDIANPRWANTTYKFETATDEIDQSISTTLMDVELIMEQESPYEAAMIAEYKSSHDIRKAMAKEKELKAIDEAAERRRQEALKFTQEEAQKSAESVTEPLVEDESGSEPVPPPWFVPPVQQRPKEKLYSLRFELKVTMKQARALKSFFEEQGIDYKKI